MNLDELIELRDKAQKIFNCLDKAVEDEKLAHDLPDGWPKRGDKFFYVADYGDVHMEAYSSSDRDFISNLKSGGNIFRTREDAEKHLSILKWMAKNPSAWRHIQVWKELMDLSDVVSGRGYCLCVCEIHENGVDKLDVVADLCDDAFIPSYNSAEPLFSSGERAKTAVTSIGKERILRDWFHMNLKGKMVLNG